MLFNTILFLVFFSVVYPVYWLLPERRRSDFLLFASAVFYVLGSATLLGGMGFFLHFLGIVLLNYFAYFRIRTSSSPKPWMIFAVLLNVINLGFFKYFYFINRILYDLTSFPFFEEVPRILQISLPLAVSFYSFQMIAAAVDAYRKPEGEIISLKKYLGFVIFFPVLIVGPILRVRDYFPNLNSLRPDKDKIVRGSYLVIGGLLKKILVADPVAGVIAPVFSHPGQYDILSLVMVAFGYAIQVYCDFSGLTDMARGVALMFGFELPENFEAPLFSPSGRVLWQRWHMTLSFWLRDYIYFSLGGSRKGEWRTYINLIITMTVGGIWHGADYTFVTWGFYWGSILALERFLMGKFGWDDGENSNRIVKFLRIQFVFALFSFSAILFRANSAKTMVQHVVGLVTNTASHFSSQLQSLKLGWVEEATSLVAGPSPFLFDTMKNMEKILYAYLGFVFFHWVQTRKDKLISLAKGRDWALILGGVGTILAIALFSEDSGVCVYCQF
ncbi:MBOAT family protein [Leptospira wolffii]|uniref:Acyltransferase n=1 Tax=Leptospira wolffii TaxID=409998 RepID=A0A2M9ZDH6_9LEPT|nr:MBOAT family O-acyltransferase [Leptospira wolffii]PJZ66483.1 acyltransferase [Leptospira wolffii]TGK59949.1 MBOAT family protein [Leptospira wolffii]TGK67595.1 MBOAT family protein [Leptospira wolffii]TGK75957.1 MBOAT family protein [Leptospira wolffii]TGL30208.1 MBOAT family protein [Leptospira wolffii]